MDPNNDISSIATCTSCTFSEDFSDYWTAVLYFRARNGTFKRVPQIGNQLFEDANGGVTVYYLAGKNKVTAFKKVSYPLSGVAGFPHFICIYGGYEEEYRILIPLHKQGFRMITGDPMIRTKDEAQKYRQLTYTCLQTLGTRTGETKDMPTKPCPAGIMANLRFPT